MTDVKVACHCGAVRGTARGLEPSVGNRALCYCLDCRAYAHYLGTEIVDAHGGSDIFQMPPARLRIDAGAKHLACVRLSAKGVFRWYASCCRTPVANGTGAPRVPFVGVVQPFMRHTADAPRDEVLGPVRMWMARDSALGGVPPEAGPNRALDFVRGTALLLGAALRGQHAPSPFFGRDGRTIVKPTRLSPAEHEALREKARHA